MWVASAAGWREVVTDLGGRAPGISPTQQSVADANHIAPGLRGHDLDDKPFRLCPIRIPVQALGCPLNLWSVPSLELCQLQSSNILPQKPGIKQITVFKSPPTMDLD